MKQDKKKVAIIYQGARFYGGIEKYLELLFENIDQEKLDLTLISLGSWDLGRKLSEKSENVIEVPFHWFDFRKLYSLYRLLLEGQYNLVVSQGMVANLYARIPSYFAKIPSLITVHSNYDYDFHGTKKSIYYLTFRLFDFMTGRYIVVSRYLREKIQELGVKPEKINVVYNGVKEIEVSKKALGKEKILGTIGRLHYTKGYHNLIHAVSLIKDENFKLYIWGEGEEKNQLADLIRQHHLADKVEFKGFASDITDALKMIDIYIQPSLSEGFGMTVVEAMYAEKPIVVTPAGSLSELIDDGINGLVTKGFSPESIAASLQLIINDNTLAKSLSKAAKLSAQSKFGIEKWARETEKVYLEAAK